MNAIHRDAAVGLRFGLEGACAIIWADLAALRRSLGHYLLATVVTPILYIAAFVFGLGGGIRMDGMNYLQFVVPGIIAMTAMNSSFNGAGTRLVVDQIHWRSFDESLMAPIGRTWLLLGKAGIGVLRGLASSIAFLIIAMLITPAIHIGPLFLITLLFACSIFSFLGVLSALLARSYDDMILFTSVIIMPMGFLGGTFFSLDYLPPSISAAIHLLPLTHVSICLRAGVVGSEVPYQSLLILLAYLIAFAGAAILALRHRDE